MDIPPCDRAATRLRVANLHDAAAPGRKRPYSGAKPQRAVLVSIATRRSVRPTTLLGLSRATVRRVRPARCGARRRRPCGSAVVVVDDLDVVPVRVQDERAVVARVVDGALAGTAVV